MKKVNCILLVDDNPADNYYNQYIIKDADVCHNVHIAINGVEALAYLRRSAEPGHNGEYPKPDIIFLDINMPRMNGFEFLEEYKHLDERMKSKVLVVMLTTSLNQEDKQKAMTFKEVDEFINKPLSPETLHEIVGKVFTVNALPANMG